MKIPDEPKEGFPIYPWARKLLSYLRATRITSVIGGRLRESASGTTLEIIHPKQRRTTPTKPALWVSLRAVPAENPEDPPEWEIYAEYGHVVPHHNASSDTGAPIEITYLPTNDAPLTVVEDEKIWVKRTVNASGKVTSAVWESGSSWPDDTPPVLIGGDDQTGATGYRHTRIAEIIANPDSTATPPTLIRKQLHTGHIDHVQPTLSGNTTTSVSGGEARVMKVWNAAAGRWYFRYIEKGLGQNTITENGDSIEIRGTQKDSDVTVWVGDYENPDPILSFRDGYETTGANVVGDEDPAVNPSTKELFIPTVVAWDDPDAQIQVDDIGVNGVVYEIRGNGAAQTLTYSVNGGSAVDFAVFKDGLFVSGANIEITVSEGDGLPEGSAGDMLYHDGENWVVLANPGAPGSDAQWVLHHDGTTPAYTLYTEVTVDICVSGSPVEYKILGIPTI